MPTHEVAAGDCLSSIAAKHGFDWRVVWEHGPNGGLRNTRKDPNVLLPGDLVHIPDKQLREETRPTNQAHRFKIKGSQTRVRLRLLWLGEPRKNLKCTLEVDGRPIQKTTDGDGKLEATIPPGARRARLIVHGDEGDEHYEVALGTLDPLETLSGQRQRLTNLGFPCGPEADEEALSQALQAFQMTQRLEVTGQLDGATKDRLRSIHGS